MKGYHNTRPLNVTVYPEALSRTVCVAKELKGIK
jgi:hypothetical protein